MSRKNSAGSSITDLVGIQPRVFLQGGNVPVWHFPELGAETFLAGEMVCMSGAVGSRIGLTKPGTDASGYGIAGFAADPAEGVASSKIGVFLATPDTVFVGNVGHSTVSANAQTAALDCFQTYGLTSLSGRTYVDKLKGGANVSTGMVRVLGFVEQDNVPSFYGRVYFQMLAPTCQLVNSIMLNTSSPVALAL